MIIGQLAPQLVQKDELGEEGVGVKVEETVQLQEESIEKNVAWERSMHTLKRVNSPLQWMKRGWLPGLWFEKPGGVIGRVGVATLGHQGDWQGDWERVGFQIRDGQVICLEIWGFKS